MRAALTAVTMVGLTACGWGAPAKLPRLFTDAEVSALDAAMTARIEANRARRCPRPLLRGAPLPGPAAADLRALVEPSGELARCLGLYKQVPGWELMAELPAEPAQWTAFDGACGDAIDAAITRAVSHEDACSPYQVGVGVEPEIPGMTQLWLEKLVDQRARLLARRGETSRALWLLLDAIRAFQDLARGHVSLIRGMVYVAAKGKASATFESLLATATLSEPELASLAAALLALHASEPPFVDTLRGEHELSGLHAGLANLRPASWVPPGGASKFFTRSRLTDHAVDVRDQAALALSVPEHETECPTGSTISACAKQFPVVMREPSEHLQHDPWRVLLDRRDQLRTEAKRHEVQRALIDALHEPLRTTIRAYLDKRAIGQTRWAALRIAVQIKQLGRCPELAEIPEGVRTPPMLGEPVTITREPSRMTVAPPAWVKDDATGRDEPVESLRCPPP